jgi:hypothetical protein
MRYKFILLNATFRSQAASIFETALESRLCLDIYHKHYQAMLQ